MRFDLLLMNLIYYKQMFELLSEVNDFILHQVHLTIESF